MRRAPICRPKKQRTRQPPSRQPLHHTLVRWLGASLRGRQSRVIWQGTTSGWCLVKTGVSHGSVLAPSLFHFFVADCPVESLSFADDFAFSRSGVDLRGIEAGLREDLDNVVQWASSKRLFSRQPSPTSPRMTTARRMCERLAYSSKQKSAHTGRHP